MNRKEDAEGVEGPDNLPQVDEDWGCKLEVDSEVEGVNATEIYSKWSKLPPGTELGR